MWLNVVNKDNWWTNRVSGLHWGAENNDDDSIYKLDSTLAFTDTGTSCIYGPSMMIKFIRDRIMPIIPDLTADDGWGYTFDCSIRSSLPSFWLLFGNHWFEV